MNDHIFMYDVNINRCAFFLHCAAHSVLFRFVTLHSQQKKVKHKNGKRVKTTSQRITYTKLDDVHSIVVHMYTHIIAFGRICAEILFETHGIEWQ